MSSPIHVRNLWLDVDPVSQSDTSLFSDVHSRILKGHDDAVAILLAIHCINTRLLGVSTVKTICMNCRSLID